MSRLYPSLSAVQQLLFSSSKMRNGLWRDSVICQRGRERREEGEKERVERQKVAEKDGESMNGSLGIQQRQREVSL